MATSFEFEVLKNLSGAEGSVEGYFGVQRNFGGDVGLSRVFEAVVAVNEQAPPDSLCIPIMLNEYSVSKSLTVLFKYQDVVSGIGAFVTFGEDKDAASYKTRLNKQHESHLDIVAREVVKDRPTFLMSLLEVPGGVSNEEWERSTPLCHLHLRYGSVLVRNKTCVIALDESVPQLEVNQ